MAQKKDAEKKKQDYKNCLVFVAVALVPLALWLLCTLLLFPPDRLWPVIIGGIGALPLGFVLWTAVISAKGDKKDGFLVFSGIPLAAGVVLTVSAVVALYLVPDGNVMTLYFVGLIFQLVNVIFTFPFFRNAVEDKLRRERVSKSRIKKLKQGARNYWFLTALHKECDIGIAYPLNAAFVVVFPTSVTMQLLLGWCRPLLLPVGIAVTLSLALGVLLQIITMRCTIYDDWRGRLYDFCILLLVAFSTWAEMSLTLAVIAGKTVYTI